MTYDFGFVTLDLNDVYERDQGVYTCKASNKSGEAFTSTTIYCTGKFQQSNKFHKFKDNTNFKNIFKIDNSTFQFRSCAV